MKKEQQETEVYTATLPLSSAVRTGLEPATPGVTGRYSNHLNYRTKVCTANDSLSLWNCYRSVCECKFIVNFYIPQILSKKNTIKAKLKSFD